MKYSTEDDPEYWFELEVHNEDRREPSSLAALAAEDYQDNHDGWESSWPLVIAVSADHLEAPVAYRVEREYEPVFTALSDPVDMPTS